MFQNGKSVKSLWFGGEKFFNHLNLDELYDQAMNIMSNTKGTGEYNQDYLYSLRAHADIGDTYNLPSSGPFDFEITQILIGQGWSGFGLQVCVVLHDHWDSDSHSGWTRWSDLYSCITSIGGGE